MPGSANDQMDKQCEKGFSISFSSDELKAYLLIDSKEIDVCEITCEDINRNLTQCGMVHGIDQPRIDQIIEEKLFNKKFIIANGTPPQMGKAAVFKLTFDPERKIAPKEGDDGRIDYRDMDFLLNAEPGQVLVNKIPPKEGIPGKTVTGKEIPAKTGKDKKIPKGSNTELSEDGMTLVATIAGTIVYSGSTVSIQSLTSIPGNVDLATGNITCNGSLKIGRDIKSGMQVKVKGDLEVGGNVEDAEIVCEGNVTIKGGFVGRGDGSIIAKGNVTVKYISSQSITCNGNVVIGGEAINARIFAKDQIKSISTKGKIVGGMITARKLIQAMVLGADAGTSTILRVAYDKKLMKRAREVNDEIERLEADGKRVKTALVDLFRLKMDNKLPKAQEAVLKQLEGFKKNLPGQLAVLETEQKKIEIRMKDYKDARIIAEKNIYPGVQIHIGTQVREVETARGAMLFELYTDSISSTSFDKKSYESKQKKLKQENVKAAQAALESAHAK
jgi:uncharacterized protein